MKFVLFMLFILLLSLLCLAAYRQLKGDARRGASNRDAIDPSRVAEAEYSVLDGEEVEREGRG